MPIIVFGNSFYSHHDKINTSLFVQKPYLRTIYIEANIEEDIDLKGQYRIKNLLNPISIRETASKDFVDSKFNDPSIVKNTDHVDFNEENLDNVHSIKVNSFPSFEGQLTQKIYVDQAISNGVHESSLLGLDPDEKLKLDEQDSIVLNSTLTIPKTKIKLPTESFVDYIFNDPGIIKTLVVLISMIKVSIM